MSDSAIGSVARTLSDGLSHRQRSQQGAVALYKKAGYQFYSHYETIYLR